MSMLGKSAVVLVLAAAYVYYNQYFNMSGDSNFVAPIFISHGAGPIWFIDGKERESPNVKRERLASMDKNSPSAAFMRILREKANLPRNPTAILVISAHWEESKHTVLSSPKHTLYYDYYNFPPETYKIEWPAPGAPQVAQRVCDLLEGAGIPCEKDGTRGLDHGVFIPLKLVYPEADVPVLQLSLCSSLNIEDHLRLGELLQPLTTEGVLIVGSGQTTHPTNGIITPENNRKFGDFIHDVLSNSSYSSADRKAKLVAIRNEPSFGKAHQRIEHFLPIIVTAGAAGYRRGTVLYDEPVIDGQMLVSHISFKG